MAYHRKPIGRQLRVLRPTRVRVQTFEVVKPRADTGQLFTVGSVKMLTLQPGELVEYVDHYYGAGSDPSFEVMLRRSDKSIVILPVGWFDLRTEDFALEDDADEH